MSTEKGERSPLSLMADKLQFHPGMYGLVSGLHSMHDETAELGWATCPAPQHVDSNPSFAIYRNDSHGHCFSCGYHRGAMGLVMDRLGLDFRSAMEWALERLDLSKLEAIGEDGRRVSRPGAKAPVKKSVLRDRIRTAREIDTLYRAAVNSQGTDEGARRFIELRSRMDGFLTARAARDMALDLGVDLDDQLLPYRPSWQPQAGSPTEDSLDRVNRLAQDLFVRWLGGERGRIARDYLAGRNIPESVVDRFGVGYCIQEKHAAQISGALGGEHGVTLEQLIEAGICGLSKRDDASGEKRRFSRFAGRLTIPISDSRGRVVGFSGRDLSGEARAKYLNTPETDVFHKGDFLYNLHRASPAIARHGSVLVVEGYSDVWALWMAGIDNVVATMGTALTDAQAEALARCGTVYLALDADEAGRNAMIRAFPVLLRHGAWPRVFDSAWAEKDPGDYFKTADWDELAAAAVIGAEDSRSLYRLWCESMSVEDQVAFLDTVEDPWAYGMLRQDFALREVQVPPEPRTIGGFALRA